MRQDYRQITGRLGLTCISMRCEGQVVPGRATSSTSINRRHLMANISPPTAPPHDEPDAQKRASTSSGNAADERTHRSRLAATGVYRTQGDTGSSGRVSAPAAT